MTAPLLTSAGLKSLPVLLTSIFILRAAAAKAALLPAYLKSSCRQLTTAGTTTVIGLLGTDGVTRSMENLLAKARGLEEEGISTWIYSGAYPADSGHITGTLRSDIVLIDKILGGKVAMSDHRSSMPSTQAYASLAAEARIGGMLSGKAGVLHIHMGDGKRGLEPVLEILETTELPISVFRPTHVNRNPMLTNRLSNSHCRAVLLI